MGGAVPSVGLIVERLVRQTVERAATWVAAPGGGRIAWRSGLADGSGALVATVTPMRDARDHATHCCACQADDWAAIARGHAEGCAREGPNATLALAEAACRDAAAELEQIAVTRPDLAAEATRLAGGWRTLADATPPRPTATWADCQRYGPQVTAQWADTRALVTRYFAAEEHPNGR